MIAVGADFVAFGTSLGGTNGVAFIRPPEATATPLADDDFRGDAVYVAGSRIIGVRNADVRAVLVYDTATGATVAVPDTDVWDIAPGSNLENNDIAVEGSFVAILHRGAAGKVLKVIDVSTATPQVTTFDFALTDAGGVDVDAETGQVAVMEDNSFISIFPASGPAGVQPVRFAVAADAGLSIATSPKVQINSSAVFFQELQVSNVHVLRADTGATAKLIVNPAANSGLTNLEARAGYYAYFLNLNAADNDASQGSRLCVGTISDVANAAIATGNDLGGGARSGFGRSVAISPDGAATYIAGRFGQSAGGGVNEPSYLQIATTAGFVLLKDANNTSILAGDVVATDTLVAFKVADGNSAVLGYYAP
jgi:hypothetical protein